MPNINLSFAQDPNTLALALIYGMVPAVAWLFFWLREQRARPKGTGSLLYAFMAGALMVIAALPVEKFLGTFSTNVNTLTILWATAEEVLKFSAFLLMLFAGSSIEAPVDYAMYAVVVALGFAGFENALYFLQPLQTGDSVVLLLAGAMRFLGTTLMHAAAASIPGIALGLAHYKPRHVKQTAAIAGVILAATLHSTFNIWIVQNNGLDFFTVFTFLWIVTIAVLALFEVLRKMGGDKYVGAKRTNAMGSVSALVANFVSKIGATPLEEKPFTTFLAEKGLAPTAPEYAELAKVIGTLREAYTAYLASEGAPQADAAKVVLAVIPDALSPKAAEGIVAVLVRAAEAPAVAEIAA